MTFLQAALLVWLLTTLANVLLVLVWRLIRRKRP
jgi:hypothetical protein